MMLLHWKCTHWTTEKNVWWSRARRKFELWMNSAFLFLLIMYIISPKTGPFYFLLVQIVQFVCSYWFEGVQRITWFIASFFVFLFYNTIFPGTVNKNSKKHWGEAIQYMFTWIPLCSLCPPSLTLPNIHIICKISQLISLISWDRLSFPVPISLRGTMGILRSW